MSILKTPLTVSGKAVNTMRKACVYAWVRNERFLYVGCSGLGLSRLLTHNTIGKVEPVLDEDEIRYWQFEDGCEAFLAEAEMIAKYQPKYNSAGRKYGLDERTIKTVECLVCREPFKQNRYWQRRCGKYGCK